MTIGSGSNHKMTTSTVDVREVMAFFDKDGSGKLNNSELTGLLNAMGQCVTTEEVDAIMKEEDINGDGQMDKIELKSFLKKHVKESQQVVRELRQAFRAFDRDNSGYVDTDELEHVLTHSGKYPLSSEEAHMFVKSFDTSGDNRLDIEEFLNFMCGLCPTAEDLDKFDE